MELSETLRAAAADNGASFFGIADLSPARDEILGQGGKEIAQYPYAISIGIALLNSIVDQLPMRAEKSVAMLYRHHGYGVVNTRMDAITSRLANMLQAAGHRALPIPASQTIDSERRISAFSNKMAAHLSGLGWIGKSCLMVTPQVGTRARWASVLTDAPLVPTGTGMEQQCGECSECVDICPVKAFTGKNFVAGEARSERFDTSKCSKYLSGDRVCGMCLYICPYGRKKAENAG